MEKAYGARAVMKEYVLKSSGPSGPFRIDYAKELNPQQLEVVMAGDGPLLVIAGAGSGKTRTLTYRVARLIESGVDPRQILLLTFTNKAAREMIRRVDALLPGDTRRITGGTFHHVGNLVLRRNAALVGYPPGFTILDREDSRDLMSEAAAGIADHYARFPKGDVLLDIYSYARNTGQTVERVLVERYPMFGELKDDILRCSRLYAARKMDLHLMDFDDLLVLWRDLVVKHEDVHEAQRRTWRYILVDEYQDTNRLQSEIVENIAGADGNLMVVGDDAQSIYSFRGANYENILEFPKRHPKAKMFKLEINYRSVPGVLALANDSIKHNAKQFQKSLRAVRGETGRPEVVVAGTAEEQARFVAQQVLALRDEGMDLRDMAVLYRAHYHAMELQMELQRMSIPFEVRSGLRFFEQAHIKDVSSYLKVAVNGKDELAWKRILRLVPRVGKATAEKAWLLIEKDRFGDVKAALPKAAQKGWEDLCILLGKLRSMLTTPGEMIRAVIEGGYEAHLQTEYSNFPARLEDIRRFADFAIRFESAEQLLSELALTNGVSGKDAMEEDPDEDVLVLSTVHQAKGLEWRAVFVLWLTDGRFPDARAIKDEGGEEEERRLFYVAVTRAKDRLYLIQPTLADERYLRGVIQRPSRFLKELDPETYEEAQITTDPDIPF
ncbi:MAG TPA: ATP-dependent helicase [Planctomycetota bacterium]|nr:ATP-dependent helicase [Planctomycetota bacterium]